MKVMPNARMEQSLTMLQFVVHQAMDLAKSSPLVHADDDSHVEFDPNQGYPPEEVEWITTKLFNMAIDLYAAGDRKLAQRWASQAIDVANLLLDINSGLAQLLRDKTTELFTESQFEERLTLQNKE